MLFLYTLQLFVLYGLTVIPVKEERVSTDIQVLFYKDTYQGFGMIPFVGWLAVVWPEGFIVEVNYKDSSCRYDNIDLIEDVDLTDWEQKNEEDCITLSFGSVDRLKFAFPQD